jgi:hypothetical protein
VRFCGKENTVVLMETSLTVEGNLLKVGLMGTELFFRSALAEWSSVTIPYSRIQKARYVRFPGIRLMAVLLFFLNLIICAGLIAENSSMAPVVGVVGFFVMLLTGYVIIRIPGRYVVLFRGRNRQVNRLQIRILTPKLRNEFDAKLQEYRRATEQFMQRSRKSGEATHE